MAEDPESGGEKTEDASSRKLGKAREEGQVAKSIEIPSVFVLMGGVVALWASAIHIYNNILMVFHFNFTFEKIPEFTRLEMVELLAAHGQQMFMICLPLFAGVYLVAFLSNVAQVGFAISWKAIEPKLSKLNPISGFKQKFSSRAVVEMVKNLA
ncbi:MAG: EscU/YscU/HrcU family type III secretion system export apparatus switch protein, partial [Desulfobacteraceae bacterium]|nr:EscU/YscU/HrcU family type III secretion system export apparatus switch protein [Desulfobacteraceae bacterium]